MDILAEVNAWDCENGKVIATYCGLEELTLYQYLVLLEKVRTEIDKLIPLNPVHKAVVLATIDSLAESAESIEKPTFLESEFLSRLKAAKHTLMIGALDFPLIERLSVSTCLTVLISQIGAFLEVDTRLRG